jgi:hypothetical protein
MPINARSPTSFALLFCALAACASVSSNPPPDFSVANMYETEATSNRHIADIIQKSAPANRLHAKPARKVPSALPTKYVTTKTVLMRLRASGINLYTRV